MVNEALKSVYCSQVVVETSLKESYSKEAESHDADSELQARAYLRPADQGQPAVRTGLGLAKPNRTDEPVPLLGTVQSAVAVACDALPAVPVMNWLPMEVPFKPVVAVALFGVVQTPSDRCDENEALIDETYGAHMPMK